MASYQLRDVSQIWYTQWKDNRLEGPGLVKWEEVKEAFVCMYFSRERIEIKVDEFINLKKGNMGVGEYSLKFSTLSRYAPSLLSNPRDEMIRFVTGVADLVVEECHTTMLHNDMTLARLLVYAQSIEDSKLRWMARSLKRSGASDQEQTRFKKKVQSQG